MEIWGELQWMGGAHMRHLLAYGMFMFMFFVVLNYVVAFACMWIYYVMDIIFTYSLMLNLM